jgi:GNAT superfamily N-acetyltransferase
MNVRLATPLRDRARVLELAAAFLTATPYGALTAWQPEAVATLVDQVFVDGTIFVAERARHQGDGTRLETVGLIALVIRQHPFNLSYYGDELAWWVDPTSRNSTAAYRLLWAAIEWARQNRLSVLKMVAPAGSPIGLAYLRRGFTLVETVYQLTL